MKHCLEGVCRMMLNLCGLNSHWIRKLIKGLYKMKQYAPLFMHACDCVHMHVRVCSHSGTSKQGTCGDNINSLVLSFVERLHPLIEGCKINV